MRKNIIIAVLATIVVGFVALMIIGFVITKEEQNSYIPPSIVQSDVQYDNQNVFKQEYMKGCDDGTMTDYCACTYDYLTARYTLAQIAKMGDEYEKTGDLTEEMWAAVDACL